VDRTLDWIDLDRTGVDGVLVAHGAELVASMAAEKRRVIKYGSLVDSLPAR
jgi:hypothetical protein